MGSKNRTVCTRKISQLKEWQADPIYIDPGVITDGQWRYLDKKNNKKNVLFV